MAVDAKRICNGTFGEVWVDDEIFAECYKAQAKVEFQKEDIKQCGTWATDSKTVGYKGTGSLTLYKVNTRLAKKISEKIKNKQEVRCTVISKLADPDSYGSERVALYNVSFDDLTLFDWEAQKPAESEHPFTFTDYKYLDEITAQ
jgi:hypothetical protein